MGTKIFQNYDCFETQCIFTCLKLLINVYENLVFAELSTKCGIIASGNLMVLPNKNDLRLLQIPLEAMSRFA